MAKTIKKLVEVREYKKNGQKVVTIPKEIDLKEGDTLKFEQTGKYIKIEKIEV